MYCLVISYEFFGWSLTNFDRWTWGQTCVCYVYSCVRAIFVWPWKKVSVSVRSLFHQPMDEKIKTWPLRFPAKETLIWRRHCSIGQSCCSMTSKKFLESSSGMKFVYPRVRLANQNPGAFVSVSYTNQIALFPFVCCFCFVRAFSFQGHTKIALLDY